ncbi:hypothetical protein CVV65_05465 [Kyrpidia spormannii]|uniref:Uncharacterized protein n=1 Tax=Kyrpidia spormannii TaxID=2055160 RepID=A0A2K8N529_9BACL|nr:hypothetical protein CVV65_05465 [Kyrpidia spormannii]
MWYKLELANPRQIKGIVKLELNAFYTDEAGPASFIMTRVTVQHKPIFILQMVPFLRHGVIRPLHALFMIY